MRRVFLLLAALLGPASPALGASLSEYGVKSAYLFNFAKSVDWPKAAFTGSGSPLVVGILGSDPFGPTLDNTLKGRIVSGRPLEVKRFASYDPAKAEGLKACHILFIAESEKDRLKEILGSLKGAHLLTVSENERFHSLGGMVAFEKEGDRIVPALNPKTLRQEGLVPGAELLKAARLVYKADPEKVKTLYYEGVQLYLAGKVREAIRKWNECLEEDPRHPGALKNLDQAREKLRSIKNLK